MGASLGFHVKLSVVTIAIVLITVIILSMSHIFMTRQEYLRQGRDVLVNVSGTLENSVSLQHTLMQRKLRADRDIMRTHFELGGFPIPEVLMDVEMRLVDQETGAQSTETIPAMKHGAAYLHEDSSVVRRISELTGAVVSVLQVHNGRLVRISTSLEAPLPQWGKGSYIAKSTPVHADIMQGKPTEALLWMGGMWRLTAYAPIKDLNGTVLGALEVAHPLISDAFAEFVRGVRVGGHGGSFAFDAQGRTLTGPNSSDAKIDHALISHMNTAQNAAETAQLLSVEMDDGKHIEVALHPFAPWNVTFVTWVGGEELMAGVTSRLVRSSALSVIVPLVLSIVLTGIACKILLAPIRAMAVLANDVANGNYSRTITYPAHDSIGRLATALNTMVSSTKDMLTGIAEAANSLSGAAEELDTASGSLTRSSSKTAEMSHAVHDLAKSVSANMRSISSAMEEAATNVHSVAGAAEELSATITEVTHSTEHARVTTADAVCKAGGTTAHVRELEEAAKEISAVIATISAISSQTNLLALNATIEAARAGDAGKGFAVVANEIKELSRQTASATEDIKERITAIQSLTTVTTHEISEIIDVIQEMHGIVAIIATAVGEQASMTREIANNVGHASQGIAEISSNVASSSTMTQGINDAVELALDASQSMHARSELVHAKSAELGNLSGQLQRLVERFEC